VSEGGTDAPAVSVILPAYRSEQTLRRCLEALERQTWRDFEVLVADSSPDGASARIAREAGVGSLWVDHRLLPHAARNLGAARARGGLLVFSDPDVYPQPDWLERLVAAYRANGETTVGALACFGSRWLDRGVHLCKFSKWLPGQRPRAVDMSPTAAMLISREDFVTMGGFPDDELLGDVTFSRRLLAAGRRLLLEPAAVAEHNH
jgi:GT2 family glycosyltransferase